MTDDACKYLSDQNGSDPNKPAEKIYLTARNKNVNPPSHQEHMDAIREQTRYRKWRTEGSMDAFEAVNEQVEPQPTDFPDEIPSATPDPEAENDIPNDPKQLGHADNDSQFHVSNQDVDDDDDYQAILDGGL